MSRGATLVPLDGRETKTCSVGAEFLHPDGLAFAARSILGDKATATPRLLRIAFFCFRLLIILGLTMPVKAAFIGATGATLSHVLAKTLLAGFNAAARELPRYSSSRLWGLTIASCTRLCEAKEVAPFPRRSKGDHRVEPGHRRRHIFSFGRCLC